MEKIKQRIATKSLIKYNSKILTRYSEQGRTHIRTRTSPSKNNPSIRGCKDRLKLQEFRAGVPLLSNKFNFSCDPSLDKESDCLDFGGIPSPQEQGLDQ